MSRARVVTSRQLRYAKAVLLFCGLVGIGYGTYAFLNAFVYDTASSAGLADMRSIDSDRTIAAAFDSTNGFQYQPPPAGTYQLPAIKPAPDGDLLDHTARPVRLSERIAGKYTLVSFVYLNCADTEGCPLAMATLWKIFDGSAHVPGLKDALQLATISFDPARDTPEALSVVADSIRADRHVDKKIDWHFFTGQSVDALQPLLSGFGQSVSRSKGNNTINHLLRLFLVDPNGQIRNVYGLGSIDPRLIITDLQTLLLADGKELKRDAP